MSSLPSLPLSVWGRIAPLTFGCVETVLAAAGRSLPLALLSLSLMLTLLSLLLVSGLALALVSAVVAAVVVAVVVADVDVEDTVEAAVKSELALPRLAAGFGAEGLGSTAAARAFPPGRYGTLASTLLSSPDDIVLSVSVGGRIDPLACSRC